MSKNEKEKIDILVKYGQKSPNFTPIFLPFLLISRKSERKINFIGFQMQKIVKPFSYVCKNRTLGCTFDEFLRFDDLDATLTRACLTDSILYSVLRLRHVSSFCKKPELKRITGTSILFG